MTKKRQPASAGTRKRKRKIDTQRLLALIISITLIVEIVGGLSGLLVIGTMLRGKPTLNLSDFQSKESSQIFDSQGELIADVGKQIRSNVVYEQLPNSLVDAFVSIEDSRYFVHNGFDVSRFVKAMLVNIKDMNFSQGGSTLVMQLAKMTFYMDDEKQMGAPKKIQRKVQEIALAMELDKISNKKALFEMYLNKLNFGGAGNIRGVQTAAYYYFAKDVSELTLSESAMLAGIINRPYAYNPFRYLDYATKRRNDVLNMMERHGYISKTEATLAKAIKVEDLLVDVASLRKTDNGSSHEYAYQSYIDTVIQEVQQATGLDPTSVSMKIYTYMDKNVQNAIDSIQSGTNTQITYPDDLMEIAIVSLNNQNGQIVGIGGGRNYGRGGSLLLNHATQQYKQPGSSVKPFLSYALAFEHLGWSSAHVVTDRPIAYRGTTKVIKNSDGKYYGQVTLESAVGRSLNTPAIATLQDVIDNVPNGKSIVVNYLKALGFSKVTTEKFDLGYAIGGSSYECSAVELAAAHAAMINGGNYIKPHTIQKIIYNDGTEPFEPLYTADQVISAEAAYLTAQLMYQAINGPYVNYMQLLKRDYPTYGKTGTSDWGNDGLKFNIPKGAAKDRWMVSETSQYTNVVWVGYEEGVKDKNTYFDSTKSRLNIPGKISNVLMSACNDRLKPGAIPKPEGITDINFILGTWPYAYPIEGMDPHFVTSGMIKKDFAQLVAPETANIEKLNVFNVSATDNALSFAWGTYPKPDQMEVAPDTMDLGIEVGGKFIEAWGPRIFDYTWVFGPVRYKATISENNAVITTISSPTDKAVEKLALSPGNHTLQVCGSYAYENLPVTSNSICQNVQIQITDTAQTITIPQTTATEAEITSWASALGIKVNFEKIIDASKKGTNNIFYNSNIANGTSLQVTNEQLKTIQLNVILFIAADCPSDSTGTPGACVCTSADHQYDSTTNTCKTKN